MVDRYGDAIEADLHHHYQLDLLDFFRGRHSWRKLANLLKRLPSTSQMVEALADDDEVGEAALRELEAEQKGKKPKGKSGPRLSEYSADVARLDVISDQLQGIQRVLAMMATHKPQAQIRPARRPETAFDRAKWRARVNRHDALVSEVEAAQARFREKQQTQ